MDNKVTSALDTKRMSTHRVFRFRLRTVLLLMACFAIWLGLHVNRARHEGAALRELRAVGAWVSFTYQKKSEWDWDWKGEVDSGVPEWLVATLGEAFFHKIGSVSFHESNVTPRSLEALSRLSAVESLSLQSQTHLTDSDLAYVASLASLECLCLWDTQISDAGIDRLKGLTSLRALGLSRTRITDAGLAKLSEFKDLEILELEGTNVTEQRVRQLRGALPHCEVRWP